jgi:hypothetical protein
MKFCEYCIANILKSRESWDYHRCETCAKERSEPTAPFVHKGPQQAEKNERCLFCSTLLNDIERFVPRLDSSKSHRWTVRSLSRIKESLETVVVTFHPLAAEALLSQTTGTSKDAVQEASGGLPTRRFYFFPEAEMGPWPTHEQIDRSTNPAINGGAQIKSWVTTCNETHESCMKRHKTMSASSHFVPTRLVDISGPPQSHMKVIETANTTIHSPYATLSHCWGPGTFVRTLPETKQEFIGGEGVPWQSMTKNFKEAIEVARFLGIDYIWIDSLCIIQGDGGDFETEGGLMHKVYRNSYCNIAIADSADGAGGAFRERNPTDVVPVRYQPEADHEGSIFGSHAWRVVAGDLYESDLLSTKLYIRGWAFQGKTLTKKTSRHQLTRPQNVC